MLSNVSWCYICNKVYAIPPQENMDYHFSSHQIISLLWLVSETLSFKGSYFVMIDSYLTSSDVESAEFLIINSEFQSVRLWAYC